MNIKSIVRVIGSASVLALAPLSAQAFPHPVPPIVAALGIVSVLLVVVGIAASVYLIVGGVRYITSQGEERKIQKAKNTILYALIWLIVIALYYAIVNLIINRTFPDNVVGF